MPGALAEAMRLCARRAGEAWPGAAAAGEGREAELVGSALALRRVLFTAGEDVAEPRRALDDAAACCWAAAGLRAPEALRPV